MALFTREEALEYHRSPRHGKTEVVLTKRCESQKDLSLAYSPGVAEACKAIAEDRALVSEYTGRANLVAVISDGTAVLGLGNIGPYAAKPVMEGKGVLFKNFADIDVFDLCLKTGSAEEFIALPCQASKRSFFKQGGCPPAGHDRIAVILHAPLLIVGIHDGLKICGRERFYRNAGVCERITVASIRCIG